MLKITINATELIVNVENLSDDLKGVFDRVLLRQNINGIVMQNNVYQIKGKPEQLYTCLFNLAIIFDIELW